MARSCHHVVVIASKLLYTQLQLTLWSVLVVFAVPTSMYGGLVMIQCARHVPDILRNINWNLKTFLSYLNWGVPDHHKVSPEQKNAGIKGQFSGSSFFGMGEFFSSDFEMFFLHPQGDLFNWPLCRLHHHKNHKNHIFFLRNLNILLFRNNLAGLVNLVNLAGITRSQYLLDFFFAFYIQPGLILVKRFCQMIILAVLSENTVQCPKT